MECGSSSGLSTSSWEKRLVVGTVTMLPAPPRPSAMVWVRGQEWPSTRKQLFTQKWQSLAWGGGAGSLVTVLTTNRFSPLEVESPLLDPRSALHKEHGRLQMRLDKG